MQILSPLKHFRAEARNATGAKMRFPSLPAEALTAVTRDITEPRHRRRE